MAWPPASGFRCPSRELLLAWLVTGTAAGCFGNHDLPGDAGAPTDAADAGNTEDAATCGAPATREQVEAFLRDLRDAECAGLLTCETDAGYVDLAQCLAEAPLWSGIAYDLLAFPDELLETASLGRMILDETSGEACLTAVATTCSADTWRQGAVVPSPLPEACRLAFRRACDVGPPTCVDHLDCAEDEYCTAPRDGWCAADGTCMPRLGAGDACMDALECGAAMLCLGGICRDVRTEVVLVGATCGLVDDDATHSTARLCAAGARCIGSSTPTCVAASARGAPCGDPAPGVCGIGDVCNEGICMARTRLRAGEPCGLDCELAQYGFACVDGSCVESDGSIAAPCSRPGACWWGLECRDGRCQEPNPRETGRDCLRDFDCESRCCVGEGAGVCSDP